MNHEALEARRLVVCESIVNSQRRLDAALTTLGQVSTEALSLGGRMARDPWAWVAGACLVGLVIGMSLADRSPAR